MLCGIFTEGPGGREHTAGKEAVEFYHCPEQIFRNLRENLETG